MAISAASMEISSTSNTTTYIFLAVFLLLLYVWTQHFFRRLQNLPPTSPFPILPLIGHLYLLRKKNVPFHEALAEVSKRYGPVLHLKFGSRPVLLVSSPSAAEECLSKNDIIFANRPPLLPGKYLGYNFTSLAWSPYGRHFRNLRRIASLELLSARNVQMLSHVRVDEVRTLIRSLLHQGSDGNLERSRSINLDIRSLLFELAFNTMTRMISGKRYYGNITEEDSKEAKAFQEIAAESLKLATRASVLDFMPFLRFFGFGKVVNRMMDVFQKRENLMRALIEEYRRTGIDNPAAATEAEAQGRKRNMIEVLLELQATESESYPDEIIRGLISVLYQASTDTSANTMEWAFSLLLNHPEVMKRAQAEIDNVIGNNRLMDDLDVAQLPYLCCIIRETMRLHPALPLLLPHFSSEDCMVAGFRIPRGTMLLVNVWGIHHDPQAWVEPEKFMPERFEGREGSKDDFKFVPFGSGRRRCPGENLAMSSIGLALGSLLQCFDWERISNQDIDMSESSGFLAYKVQSLMVNCYPRPHMISLLSQL